MPKRNQSLKMLWLLGGSVGVEGATECNTDKLCLSYNCQPPSFAVVDSLSQ